MLSIGPQDYYNDPSLLKNFKLIDLVNIFVQVKPNDNINLYNYLCKYIKKRLVKDNTINNIINNDCTPYYIAHTNNHTGLLSLFKLVGITNLTTSQKSKMNVLNKNINNNLSIDIINDYINMGLEMDNILQVLFKHPNYFRHYDVFEYIFNNGGTFNGISKECLDKKINHMKQIISKNISSFHAKTYSKLINLFVQNDTKN